MDYFDSKDVRTHNQKVPGSSPGGPTANPQFH